MARTRRICIGGLVVLAVLASETLAASAHRPAPRAPVLGDWEGVGPEGLPLSFSLARLGGAVSIRNLTVGDPLFCPGRLAPTDAIGYPSAIYIGPGAPPRVRINWRPNQIVIRVGMGAPFSPEWDGQLLGPHQATLSEPAPTNEPRGCGWRSKRLTWRVAPARRMPVTAGDWTGTVSVPGGSGTVSVKVAPSGRIVELFRVAIQCESGGGHFEVGPSTVGEFVSADGTFEDANRPAAFQGRFGPGDTLTGTLSFSGCGPSGFAFVAHPG
jgi:hypothetical protein